MASISDYILSGATQDALIPSEEWARRAREILAYGSLRKAEEERERERQLRPTEIWPGNTFQTEDIPESPNNWLYNTLSDPQLNRGLENLAESASDVILGRESGNTVVDLGTSNIPGVGAASILAAGGMPGIVDAVGAGELKNMKRIPKYTYEFVKEFFGDKGLRNLDNALTMYPKAEKPSVNDARYILKTGLGGEKLNAIKPYSTDDVTRDIDLAVGVYPGKFNEVMRNELARLRNHPSADDEIKAIIDRTGRMYDEGLENNDILKVTAAKQVLTNINSMFDNPMTLFPGIRERNIQKHLIKYLDKPTRLIDTFDMERAKSTAPDVYKRLTMLGELADSPTQNWEKIAADQKYLDEHPEIVAEQARKAEEAALKAKLSKMSKKERKAYEEKLRKQQQQQQQQKAKPQARKQAKEAKTEQPKAEVPLQEKVPQKVQETVQGGPNMWRENGWDPNMRGDVFYGKFGGNLSDDSKRDMFVLDSLANHWARKIVGEGKEGKLSEADIVDALDRADARHKRSNYDEVSQGFYDDLKKNIGTGNMPGKAVTFGPKYRKNVMTDRDTPTLILDPSEKPRFYNDVRIWADEQDGPDLYEMVFRPKSDEILNSINPEYWLYRSR